METKGNNSIVDLSELQLDSDRHPLWQAGPWKTLIVTLLWLAVLQIPGPGPVSGAGLDPAPSVYTDNSSDTTNGVIKPLDEADLFGTDEWMTEEVESIADPLEPVNRLFFKVNDRLYYWVIKPVARIYGHILPERLRIGVRNCFDNLQAPIRLANSLLQGKVRSSAVVLARFMINTTIGVGGFGDPAQKKFDLAPEEEDFGQTLGHYGIGNGVYICWPILGPSSARDSCGLVVDSFLNPTTYLLVEKPAATAAIYGGQRINLTSLSLEEYDLFKKYSFDPYVALREAYVQYRRNLTQDRATRGSSLFSECTDAGCIPAKSLK